MDKAVTKAAGLTSQRVQGEREDPTAVCFQGILHLLFSESSPPRLRTAALRHLCPAGKRPRRSPRRQTERLRHTHCVLTCKHPSAPRLRESPEGDQPYLSPLPSRSHSTLSKTSLVFPSISSLPHEDRTVNIWLNGRFFSSSTPRFEKATA